MPWKPSDASHKTKKANTPKKKSLWSRIANRLLAGGASDKSAIRQADSVVARLTK